MGFCDLCLILMVDLDLMTFLSGTVVMLQVLLKPSK